MAALLSENRRQDNGSLLEDQGACIPALHSWREELPAAFVRALAYLGGGAVLSMVAAQIFQSTPVITAATAIHPQPEWTEIERPFPAFALTIPEAADVPSSYAIRRHADGGGRKDILTLGDRRQRRALSAGRDLPAGQ